jgi:hypothetical protein
MDLAAGSHSLRRHQFLSATVREQAASRVCGAGRKLAGSCAARTPHAGAETSGQGCARRGPPERGRGASAGSEGEDIGLAGIYLGGARERVD